MEVETLKFWAQFGAMAVFAGTVLWLYSKQTDKHEQNWRDITDRITNEFRGMHEDSKLLIRECTASFTQCIALLKQLQRQVESWDGVSERRTGERRRPGG